MTIQDRSDTICRGMDRKVAASKEVVIGGQLITVITYYNDEYSSDSNKDEKIELIKKLVQVPLKKYISEEAVITRSPPDKIFVKIGEGVEENILLLDLMVVFRSTTNVFCEGR